MADVIGSALIEIIPDGRNLGPRIQQLFAQTTSQFKPEVTLSAQTSAARRAVEEAIPKRKIVEVQANGLDQIRGVLDQIGQRLGTIAGGVGGISGALGVGAAVFGVKSLVGAVQNLFDPLEKARLGFKAILGPDAGEKFLQEIRLFAKVTPFETQPLVEYSQRLLGIGTAAKDIIPLLTNVGNLVTAKGGDNEVIQRVLFALTQIKAVGRLTGQDALQLQSALINPYQLIAEQTGKTLQEVRNLGEKGKITADQVFAAVSAAGTKFAGAMEANTKTISGAISVLSDTVSIFLQDNLRPVFDFLVVAITDLAGKFQANIPKIQAFFVQAVGVIGPIVNSVKEAFKDIGTVVVGALGTAFSVLGPIIVDITKFLSENAAVVKALAIAYLGLKLVDFIQSLQRSSIALAQDTAAKLRNLGVTRELAAAQASLTTATNGQRFNVPLSTLNPNAVTQQLPNKSLAAIYGNAEQSASRLSNVVRTVGPTVAITLGSIAQQSDNAALKVAGTTAQFAGLGLALGGPVGAAIGGGVGLAAGLISKFSEDAKKKLKEVTDAAKETAASLTLAFEAQVKAEQGRTGASVLDPIGTIAAKRKEIQEALDKVTAQQQQRSDLIAEQQRALRNPAERARIAKELLALPSKIELIDQATLFQSQLDGIKNGLLKDTVASSTAVAAALNATNDDTKKKLRELGLFAGVQTRGGNVSLGNEVTVDAQTGAFGNLNEEVLRNIELKAKASGLSITSPQDIEKLLTLTQATVTYTNRLKDLADAYDLAKKAAAEQNRQILSSIAPLRDISGVQQSFADTLRALTDAKGDIGSVYGQVTGGLADIITGYQSAGITGAEFDRAIGANVASLVEAAKAAGGTDGQMKALLSSIQQILSNAKINIVVDADTAAAVEKINELKTLLAQIAGDFTNATNPGDAKSLAQRAIRADDAIATAQDSINAVSSALTNGLLKPGAVTPKKPETPQETAAEKVQAQLEALAERLKSAAEEFKQKVVDAGKQLVADLFSPVNFNTSKSVGSLTRNALKQAGYLDKNNEFLADLKAKGLSQQSLDALGITGAVGDFKRLRKLDASSPDELAALDAAISKRKASSEKTAEQSRAAVWADEFHKMLEDLFKSTFTGAGGLGTGTEGATNFSVNVTPSDLAGDQKALASKLVDAVLAELRRKGTKR